MTGAARAVAISNATTTDVQVPRRHEHARMPQPIPQPVQRFSGVDGQGGGRVSKVVGADISEARGGRMDAHETIDSRHSQAPVFVPGLATPESWLVRGAPLGPRPHVAAHGRGPRS